MQKIAVITCFSYLGNKKYVFNPDYLRSDLRRIISFSHNRAGCPLDRIFILTDLVPSEALRQEILHDFQTEVLSYLRESGFSRSVLLRAELRAENYKERPLLWLKELCEGRVGLYSTIIKEILPVIRNSSVVEFASLFTNFFLISGSPHYEETLGKIFSLPVSHLFFYYTGHGVRVWTEQKKHEICLVVPRQIGEVDFYSKQKLQRIFERILSRVTAFIVFDCCHAERLLDLPYKIAFSEETERGELVPRRPIRGEVLYLSSTRNDQTCGFYTSKKEYGSLYTYYLIKFLESICSELSRRGSSVLEISRLEGGVEDKIKKYRESARKPPQNMLIGLSHKQIQKLPLWLFERHNDKLSLIESRD